MADLIETIVDTAGVGGEVDYDSLASAEAGDFGASGADLTSEDEYVEVSCRATGAHTADSDTVFFNGLTTDATRDLTIQGDTDHVALKTGYDTDRWRLEETDDECLYTYGYSYITFKGLQVKATYSSASSYGIRVNSATPAGIIIIDSCRIEGSGGAGGTIQGIATGGSSTVKIFNTIVNNIGTNSDNNRGMEIHGAGVIFNSIVRGCNIGIKAPAGSTLTIENCAIFDNTDDFSESGTTAMDYCANDDNDGDHRIAPTAGAGDWSSDFNDAGGGDFTPPGSGNLYRSGADNPSSGLYTTDMEGNAYNTGGGDGAGYSIGVIEYQAGGTTIIVPLATLKLSTYVPPISNPQGMTVPKASLALSKYVPVADVSAHVSVEVPKASLLLSRYAPTPSATAHIWVEVPKGALALTRYAPVVDATGHWWIEVPVAALRLTRYVPVVDAEANQWIEIPVAALAFTRYVPVPSVTGSQFVTVPKAALALSTYAPGIVLPVNVEVPAASLAFSRYAPTPSSTAHVFIEVPKAALALTAYVPVASYTAHWWITVPVAALGLTAFAPTVTGFLVVVADVELSVVLVTNLSLGISEVTGLLLSDSLITNLSLEESSRA